MGPVCIVDLDPHAEHRPRNPLVGDCFFDGTSLVAEGFVESNDLATILWLCIRSMGLPKFLFMGRVSNPNKNQPVSQGG